MEEAEVPLEDLNEHVHHQAEHGASWISWVALSTAILAVLAAVSGLLSGARVNEAMMNQIEASDQWAYYQAKGIKSAVLSTRIALLESLGKKPASADYEKQKQYEEEQKEISVEAKKGESDSRAHFDLHGIYSRAVTFFQIAIAIGAVAALTRRRRFFWVSLASGAVGIAFLVQGLLK